VGVAEVEHFVRLAVQLEDEAGSGFDDVDHSDWIVHACRG
jgi:hypothetical protein